MVRITTVFLDGCVTFLKKLAAEIGLEFFVYEYTPQKPVVLLSWVGSQPKLPSLLLNSHMDVVPVYLVSRLGLESDMSLAE